MHDLDRRLRGVDDIPMPDLWPSARDRAATDGPWTTRIQPPGHRRLIAAATALVLAAMAVGALVWTFRGTHRVAPPGPRTNGPIVTVQPGPDTLPGVDNTDLVATDPATGARLNLTNSPEAESDPVWSPDGTRVAFVRTTTRDGGRTFASSIVAMDADGTHPTELAPCGTDCQSIEMAWSPDDVHLVTVEPIGSSSRTRLTVLGGDEPRTTALCDSGGCAGPLGYLSIASDGTKAAYAGNPFLSIGIGGPDPESIWTVDLASLDVRRITEGDLCRSRHHACAADIDPAWSPGNRTIAFIREPSDLSLPGGPQPPAPDLILVDVDGGHPRRFPICEGVRYCDPSGLLWAWDAHSIFAAVGEQPRSLVAIGLAAGTRTFVASDPGGPCDVEGYARAWSPDRRLIAFAAGRRAENICVVRPTGGNPEPLLLHPRLGTSTDDEFAWLSADALDMSTARVPAVPAGRVPLGSPPEGTIMFASTNGSDKEDEASNVWSVSSADPTPRPLTSGDSYAYRPSISPDGTQIAFQGAATGQAEVWAMRSDGSGVRQLTDLRGGAGQPAWSPDGTQIAFEASGGKGVQGIYIMNADGAHQHLVASGGLSDPTWTPDGSAITFTSSDESGDQSIETVDLATGVTDTVIHLSGGQGSPAWSRDGSTIAFWWATDAGRAMYLADADGSNVRRVPGTDMSEGGQIAWSPDSQWLAFGGTDQVNGPQIYVVRRDGSDLRRVTDMPGFLSGTSIFAQTRDPSWGATAG